MEVYGRGGIVDEAYKQRRNLNIKGLDAFDIRTDRPDGKIWDFNRRDDRKLARQLLLHQGLVLHQLCHLDRLLLLLLLPRQGLLSIERILVCHQMCHLRCHNHQTAVTKYPNS